MENKEIAAIFLEMADLLEIKGGERYRVRAFRRIARVVETLPEPVETMLKHGSLVRVPGIGEGAIARIKEILRSGQTTDQKRLRAALPAGLRDLLRLEGLGPKTVRLIYQDLRIGSVDELEQAVQLGVLRKLPRVGEKTEQRILRAIETFRRNIGRISLEEAMRQGEEMAALVRAEPSAQEVQLAGSLRRRKETIGDTDILVASHDPPRVAARFLTLPQVAEVLVGGEERASVRLASGHQVDLRVIPRENFGAALHYFTGAQQHNIYLRARGNRLGLKISEHGVFARKDERLLWAGETEEEIFAAVGLAFIPPELRENTGEIEAAAEGRLPKLVEESDLLGDLHVHAEDVRQTALAALALRLEYLAITDDRPSLERRRLIREVEAELGRVALLSAVEVEIRRDGTLGLDAAELAGFDFVVAAVHDEEQLGRAEATQRLVRAIESGLVDCIAHPMGRVAGGAGPPIDMERVLRAARRMSVALELNADPARLDLDPVGCRQAKESGVKVALDSDARGPEELTRRRFGVYTARRGWLERGDVLTAQPLGPIREARRARMRKVGVTVPEALQAGALKKGEAEEGAVERALTRELDALEAALRTAGLDPALVERLERYLQAGADELLELALRRHAPAQPPLMTAFAILSQAPRSS
jgi:DNA polymerase (family 10)